MLVSSPNLLINLPSHILPYWKSYCLHFQNVWRSNTSQHLHCLPTGLSIIIICLIYYPILVTSSHASTHPHVVHSLQRNQTETFKIPSMYYGEGNGTPLQYSCLDNPMGGGAWWAAVHGVAEGPTQLSDFSFTFHFHAQEKETATHSSVLAWRIPGTGQPGRLQSMGSHRAGHD